MMTSERTPVETRLSVSPVRASMRTTVVDAESVDVVGNPEVAVGDRERAFTSSFDRDGNLANDRVGRGIDLVDHAVAARRHPHAVRGRRDAEATVATNRDVGDDAIGRRVDT